MDLYGINPTLRKGLSDRSHFSHTNSTPSNSHSEISKQFASNDILSSAAWSSVIHQPAQDSEPEDLPSTVDIDAIKEPATPINASAQTPAGQLHGDNDPFELSDDQNAGDSGSDSESDSESGNSENEPENADSGGDSGSCSDSDSVSSRRSSSSSKGKPASSPSSRSNSPSFNNEDNQQQFSVQETNFDQGGLKLRLSALKVSNFESRIQSDYRAGEEAENSSDSSESKFKYVRKKPKYDPVIRSRKMYSLKLKDDYKNRTAVCNYRPKNKGEYDTSMYDRDSDSETSSSSNTSPIKSYSSAKFKTHGLLKIDPRFNSSSSKCRLAESDVNSYSVVKEERFEKQRIEPVNNITKDRLPVGHIKYRKPVFNLPSLKLPQPCKLSEDSDESTDTSKTKSEIETKKENNRDTIEKLARQLTQPGNSTEHLQVLNEEDLAAVLPDVANPASKEFDLVDSSSNKKKSKPANESKKTEDTLCDSSSDAEMLPKQIVRDAINSIHVDSDVSDESDDSSVKNKSLEDNSSSSDEDGKNRRKEKGQYSSHLLEAFAEKTEQLNKNNSVKKSNSNRTFKSSATGDKLFVQRKVNPSETFRKRGRPPKLKTSSTAEVEAFVRVECTVSNVSPDSGIQSNSGSPLYHGLPSPAIYSSASPSSGSNSKHCAVPPNSKSLSLSQKALLSACKKNSYPLDQKEKRPSNITEVTKVNTVQNTGFVNEVAIKKTSASTIDSLQMPKSCKSTSVLCKNVDDMLKVPPYLGSKISPSPVNSSTSPARGNLALFQEKRGPGRPKKCALVKLNGQTSVDKFYNNNKVDNHFNKSFVLSPKPVLMSNGQSRKRKYPSPVEICLENPKKRGKKKSFLATYPALISPNIMPVFTSLFPSHKEWFRKHKKHKKKDTKEVSVNPELLKEIEQLAELFNKKCVIEDKKSLADVNSQFLHSVIVRAKGTHRIKERSKKRDSESESNSAISVLATDTKTKRRHKKSAIETPKIQATNSDQRLPLKKRHYHISASSTSSNSNQTHNDVKTRNDKHSTANVNELSVTVPPADSCSKSTVKTSSTVRSGTENQKPKPDIQKPVSKSECTKTQKTDSSTPLPKVEGTKLYSKNDQCKSTSKTDSTRSTCKVETTKLVTAKQDVKVAPKVEPTKKSEEFKSNKKVGEVDKKIADRESSIVVTPKKRHRLEEERKAIQTDAVACKTDTSAILPLRRSGRNSTVGSRKGNIPVLSDSKKYDSKDTDLCPSIDLSCTSERNAKKNAKQTLASAHKRQEAVKSDVPAKRTCTVSRGDVKIIEIDKSNKAEQSDASEIVDYENIKNNAQSNLSCEKSAKDKKTTSKILDLTSMPPNLSSSKKEKCRKIAKDSAIDGPPVLDEFGLSNSADKDVTNTGRKMSVLISALVLPDQQSTPTKQPQLITPIPSEPVTPAESPISKPPAGVFEPTRKLPPPLTRNKKVSINDVLSKLNENLKVLEAPKEKTSSLIEKIGAAVTTVDVPANERVLRSKRASIEKENVSGKKSRMCTDVTICLPKLQSCEIKNDNVNENGTDAVKPKIKRRKNRNRTGFPVKKKKKAKKDLGIPTSTAISEAPAIPQLQSEPVKEVVRAQDDQSKCPVIVKQEKEIENEKKVVAEEILQEQRIPPVLSAVEVKNEKPNEDETKNQTHQLKPKIKINKSESSSSSLCSTRALPSRHSARITIKKQLRARELKRLKRKEKKVVTLNKKRVTRSKELMKDVLTKSKNDVVKKKRNETREIRTKNNFTSQEKSECEVLKETKTKEEADRDELSDDSMKCANQKKDAAPKKRRKFISAGLFSDYYKEDRHTVPDPKNRFTPYKPEDHPYGLLPPPPYFDDWVRHRQVDFKLPYDLWWLHTHNQLPGRDVVESWKYKRIKMNVYYDVKPTSVYEAQACNCVLPDDKNKLGCGDDCINRVVFAECSPQLCPLKDRCSNQRIQKHAGDLKLTKFMTADKGIGVKTERPIKAGEYILEYVGEVVTEKEFKKRMTSLYKNDIHHYCLNLNGGLVIDGHRMGSDGRFVNHSCEPNCEIQKWSVDGLFRMALFAQRDIKAGEELTYDYNFALFNPEEGQPCRCKSSQCRGVIGGKSQRVSLGNGNGTTVTDSSSNNTSNTAAGNASNKKSRSRPRKHVRKNNYAATSPNDTNQRRRDSEGSSNSVGVLPHHNIHSYTPVTPLTAEEKETVQQWRVFLPRNLTKVQRIREKMKKFYDDKENSNSLNQNAKCLKSKQSVEFLMQLNALSQERFIKTRGLAQVEDNPEISRTLQLANCFRTIYNFVVSAKDETSGKTFSSLFMNLPSKRKVPTYYRSIKEPIDLTTIEKNIITGVYKDIESFDKDMNKLIMNNVKHYGRTSDTGIAAIRLRKEYNIAKLKYTSQLEEIIGQPLPSSFIPIQEDPGDEDEDVIRCICGLYNDEGLMIQCERCLVWQHCGCVGADSAVEHYHCERCSGREVDYEIPLDVEPPKQPKPDEKHYLTLMRDDLQIRLGDTVYVLRDIPNPETGSRHTFRTIKTFKYEDCDIYRIEQLWKTEAGEKFSFGHHYLRPHETFHEPTRKFFPNEVVKISLYETVPLDLIMGRCYVLDLNTYCKGRPVDSDPEHIYICEYRVDKAAKSFYKFPKSKQPCSISTKNYAFDKYDTRLKPSRTYAPHGDPRPTTSSHAAVTSPITKSANSQKIRTNKSKEHKENLDNIRVTDASVESSSNNAKLDEDDMPLARIKDTKFEERKLRLSILLKKLLAKKPTKNPLDASYLLDMGRRNRKKTGQITATSSNV